MRKNVEEVEKTAVTTSTTSNELSSGTSGETSAKIDQKRRGRRLLNSSGIVCDNLVRPLISINRDRYCSNKFLVETYLQQKNLCN